MTKILSQLADLKNAVQRLQEALNEQETDLIRDATIQRFEFTFELTWKTLNTFLKENGITFVGVKTVFREAARLELLDQPEKWLKYVEARNLTSHTYDLELAKKVYLSAKSFNEDLKTLIPTLETRLAKEQTAPFGEKGDNSI